MNSTDPASFLMEKNKGADDLTFDLSDQKENLAHWAELGEKRLFPNAPHGCSKYFQKKPN